MYRLPVLEHFHHLICPTLYFVLHHIMVYAMVYHRRNMLRRYRDLGTHSTASPFVSFAMGHNIALLARVVHKIILIDSSIDCPQKSCKEMDGKSLLDFSLYS